MCAFHVTCYVSCYLFSIHFANDNGGMLERVHCLSSTLNAKRIILSAKTLRPETDAVCTRNSFLPSKESDKSRLQLLLGGGI